MCIHHDGKAKLCLRFGCFGGSVHLCAVSPALQQHDPASCLTWVYSIPTATHHKPGSQQSLAALKSHKASRGIVRRWDPLHHGQAGAVWPWYMNTG